MAILLQCVLCAIKRFKVGVTFDCFCVIWVIQLPTESECPSRFRSSKMAAQDCK